MCFVSFAFTQRGWYKTEEEYYLLLFSIAVCGLRFISFSLEHCWCHLNRGRVVQLCWLFSYTFYHPFFYNGPIITYKEYVEQVREQTKTLDYLVKKRDLWCFLDSTNNRSQPFTTLPYRCRGLLRRVTGTDLLLVTSCSDQDGSHCGGA